MHTSKHDLAQERKDPQVVESEARRQVINGGHMRKQELALLHTWTWVTSRTYAEALFTSQKILQNFSHSPSHRIFRCMHEILNIDENKN